MKTLNMNDHIYMALVDCAEDNMENDESKNLQSFKIEKSYDEIAIAISELLERKGFMLVQKDYNYENKSYENRS
jgi:hypothetical protein